MQAPDPVLYPTYDPERRQARRDLLLAAAMKAAAVGKSAGYDVLVTGSVARGQVHPWSDLDLLVRRDASEDAVSSSEIYLLVLDAVGLYDDVDIVLDDEVVPALADSLRSAAVAPSDAATLGELPATGVILERCASSLRFAVEAARQRVSAYQASLADTQPGITAAAFAYLRSRIGRKAALSLKRLAVFCDQGRSPFLDGDDDPDCIRELLERLSLPVADESPFPRDPVVPARAIDTILMLIVSIHSVEDTGAQQQVTEALPVLDAWIDLLAPATR